MLFEVSRSSFHKIVIIKQNAVYPRKAKKLKRQIQ